MRKSKKIKYSKLRFLVDSYYATQRLRYASDLRMYWLKKVWNLKQKDFDYYQQNVGDQFLKVEQWLKREILKELSEYKIWNEWLKNISGIGPISAGGLIGWIRDIGRFDTISKLYAYCGLGVTKDGKAQRREKGKKINWHPKLKTLCWKIAKNFVRRGKSYRKFYDKVKKEYKEKYPEKTKIHIENMTLRKVVKLFLAHLWVVWRQLENLKISSPYPVEKLKKKYIPPFED